MNSVPGEPAGDPCPLCAAPVTLKMNDTAEPTCCPSCGCRIEGVVLLLAKWFETNTGVC